MSDPATAPDALIRRNLPLRPVVGLPDIVLHQASEHSRLGDLLPDDGAPPYWAWPWAGGIVLARYVLDHPGVMAGRRVLDLGAGGGIVAIAAAMAGAASVLASEIDPLGRAALAINAAANRVSVTIVGDMLAEPPPDVDLVLVGDLFYDEALVEPVLAFLERCRAAGLAVLVGDPGRAPLPLGRLMKLADDEVADFGAAATPAAVYGLADPARAASA